MTYHKYNILLKTLAKAKEPMTSAEIAKRTVLIRCVNYSRLSISEEQ